MTSPNSLIVKWDRERGTLTILTQQSNYKVKWRQESVWSWFYKLLRRRRVYIAMRVPDPLEIALLTSHIQRTHEWVIVENILELNLEQYTIFSNKQQSSMLIIMPHYISWFTMSRNGKVFWYVYQTAISSKY